MPRKQPPLTRPGEPTQRTKTGLEIPVPTRADFDRFIDGLKRQKAASRKGQDAPSESDPETR